MALTRVSFGPDASFDFRIGVSFASKYDGAGMERIGRPNLNLVLALDVSGSMSWSFKSDRRSVSQDDKLTVRSQGLRCAYVL